MSEAGGKKKAEIKPQGKPQNWVGKSSRHGRAKRFQAMRPRQSPPRRLDGQRANEA